MKDLLEKSKEIKFNNEFTDNLLKHESEFNEILQVCGGKFSTKIGSYLFNGKEYRYYIGMYDKQKLIYDLCKDVNEVLEIGTYMGHSLLLMLMSNPKLKITCVDIDSTYAGPATAFLQTKFPDAQINFIWGSSIDVLPTLTTKFDFFHIDGKHNNKMIAQEFFLCKNLTSTDQMKLLFDDSDTCQPLLEYIRNEHSVLEEYTPKSEWCNTFMKLKL